MESASALQRQPSPAPGPRVLLVEDDRDISDTLATMLEEAGYAVTTAPNGREALAEVRSSSPDLILLDLMMPIMDGWEFRAAQLADPSIADVPVIVLTADASAKAAAISADAFLTKPTSTGELALVVERVLLERDRRRLAARLEETERLTLLGTIAAGVGHEINNPLTYTIANLDLVEGELPGIRDELEPLRAAVQDARAGETLAGIARRVDAIQGMLAEGRAGAERVRLIVRNLQSLSRRGEDQRTLVDLTTVVESAISMVWSLIRHRARLLRSFEDVPRVWGNEPRLGQVFVNLLVNAVQALPEGGGVRDNEIRVAIGRADGGCVVEVLDNGRGMSESLVQRIFEPFFTTKGEGGGTGLGLSICREILRAHGGRIEVSSALGRGSSFRVFLPAADERASEPPPPAPKVASLPRERRRVWVLDDEPNVRRLVARLLAEHHDAQIVESAEELFTRLAAGERFDVLLCDVMMPDMSGVEVAQRMATSYPELAARVIYITGGVLGREAVAFLEESGREVLEKPFDRARLLDAVARMSGA